MDTPHWSDLQKQKIEVIYWTSLYLGDIGGNWRAECYWELSRVERDKLKVMEWPEGDLR